MYSSCEVPRGAIKRNSKTLADSFTPGTTAATSRKNNGTSLEIYENMLNSYFEDPDMNNEGTNPVNKNNGKHSRHKSASMNKSQTVCANRYVDEA